MPKLTVENVLTVLIFTAVVALLIGQILGQPILFGFVETDSMSPDIEPGDGFFAVPSSMTDEPEVGDVVVYEAEEVQGGGLTTHRVVGESDEGYVTKGDANPFTDQDGGEPPVTEDRIVADVVQVGSSALVIPLLGTAIETVRASVVAALSAVGVGAAGSNLSGVVLLVAGLVILVIALLDERRTNRNRIRSVSSDSLDTRVVLAVLLAVVLVPANLAMVGPSGTHEIGVGDRLSDAGELTGEITAQNEGLVAMLVVLESKDGDAILGSSALELPSGEDETVTVDPVSGTQGPYVVSEHRYFMLVPSPLLLSLHSASPLLAWGIINFVLSVGVVGLVVGLAGTGRVRSRSKKEGLPPATRLRRLLR